MQHRELRRVGLSLAAVLLIVPAAQAVSLPFTGTLAIQFAGPSLPTLTVPGAGTAIVNGSGGGVHLETLALPAGVFTTSGLAVVVTDPAVNPIMGLHLTVGNAAGTVAGGAGAVPLFGAAKICLFGTCGSAVANLNVPLAAVGNGGASLITGSVNMTVIGAPWTTGTAAVGSITQMGAAHGPASGTSSTAQGSGVLRLVTPIFVSTNIASGPGSGGLAAFAIMTLHFVPEPATIALMSGGLVLLAATGRARLRRR